MKAPQLDTENVAIRLVEPSIERDAELSVAWLNGELGRITMLSMGNSSDEVDAMLPTTIEKESERVKDFINRDDQLNWMIQCEGTVIGSVWVDLYDSAVVPGPSVHIMIGDPSARGKGVGSATIKTVIEYLEQQGHKDIYSRHLTSNKAADELLKYFDFIDLGEPYPENNLQFQNLIRKSSLPARD